MFYYKDRLTGTFPMASRDELGADFEPIAPEEYLVMVANAGADAGHPMRHEVLLADEHAGQAEVPVIAGEE